MFDFSNTIIQVKDNDGAIYQIWRCNGATSPAQLTRVDGWATFNTVCAYWEGAADLLDWAAGCIGCDCDALVWRYDVNDDWRYWEDAIDEQYNARE